jgi:TRAP-type uncharacterized transport system substrate-binding protein
MIRVGALLLLSLCSAIVSARAQTVPKSLQDPAAEAAIRERKNAWVVGIAGGLYGGTQLRQVDEMARVVQDGDNLRVMPFISQGSATNLEDLLYLRGVDIVVTQADVFEFFRKERATPNLEQRVHYIFRFPPSETHVIARKEIRSLADLRGKKVHFGSDGAAGTLTGPIIFQRLGIQVQQVEGMDNPTGMQKLRSGEIDAVVRVTPKPVEYVSSIPGSAGLHLVPIPFSSKFADYYALGDFTNADYPTLVPESGRVDTIAVPSVLAVYNYPKEHERYRKVERFVQRLFANWDRLLQPPNHPKWRDINLAAKVEGWTRFAAAEEELKRLYGGKMPAQEDIDREFQSFVTGTTGSRSPISQSERDALFRQFRQWRDRQGQGGRPR